MLYDLKLKILTYLDTSLLIELFSPNNHKIWKDLCLTKFKDTCLKNIDNAQPKEIMSWSEFYIHLTSPKYYIIKSFHTFPSNDMVTFEHIKHIYTSYDQANKQFKEICTRLDKDISYYYDKNDDNSWKYDHIRFYLSCYINGKEVKTYKTVSDHTCIKNKKMCIKKDNKYLGNFFDGDQDLPKYCVIVDRYQTRNMLYLGHTLAESEDVLDTFYTEEICKSKFQEFNVLEIREIEYEGNKTTLSENIVFQFDV